MNYLENVSDNWSTNQLGCENDDNLQVRDKPSIDKDDCSDLWAETRRNRRIFPTNFLSWYPHPVENHPKSVANCKLSLSLVQLCRTQLDQSEELCHLREKPALLLVSVSRICKYMKKYILERCKFELFSITLKDSIPHSIVTRSTSSENWQTSEEN